MKLIHWSYFLALEEDLCRLSRYVEFTKENFDAFSLEMAHLLLAASSEADVILKMLCKPHDPKADSERKYRAALRKNERNMVAMQVDIPRYELTLHPWKAWSTNKTPTWWTAYNKVKHYRDSHYTKAKLENVLNSMAGLFVCNLFLYRKPVNNGELGPWPQLFFLEESYVQAHTDLLGGWTLMCRI